MKGKSVSSKKRNSIYGTGKSVSTKCKERNLISFKGVWLNKRRAWLPEEWIIRFIRTKVGINFRRLQIRSTENVLNVKFWQIFKNINRFSRKFIIAFELCSVRDFDFYRASEVREPFGQSFSPCRPAGIWFSNKLKMDTPYGVFLSIVITILGFSWCNICI